MSEPSYMSQSQSLVTVDTPPPQAPDLCRACSELVFHPRAALFSSSNPFAPAQKAMLGTLGEIQARRCPFCALVAHAVFEIQRLDALVLEPDQPIGVWWGDITGLPGFNLLFKGRGNSQGTIISIFAANPATSPRPQTNPSLRLPPGCLREIHGSEISIERARGWVQYCRDNHNECRAQTEKGAPIPSVFPRLEVLRLIDVRERCLIETRRFLRYTTLSYVWGNTRSLRLTHANRNHLSEPGGIRKRWNLLARTIRDAIDFVEKMGERFIWIDSLCLIQNDPADLKLGTAVMDLVYAQSSLTIIAASGHDANAGLPGVHYGTRYPSQRLRVVRQGLTMGVHTALADLVRTSVYSTRAWTFQEQLLSRRSLYFIDNQVFFRCAMTTFSENTLDSVSCKAKPYESASGFLGRMEGSPDDFISTVSEYSTKTLTFQSDLLRAMSGIIRRLSTLMRCSWFWGAPTAFFDISVLFTSPGLLRRRQGFPSYSWTGWIGTTFFELPRYRAGGMLYKTSTNDGAPAERLDPSGVNSWLRSKTWIIWYHQDGEGQPARLVWDPEENRDFPFHDMAFIAYRQRRGFKVPSTVALDFHAGFPFPSRGWRPQRACPNYPILRFWTVSLPFKVRIFDAVRGLGDVVDCFGKVCGTLRIDGFEETTAFESEGPFPFIILSGMTRESRCSSFLDFMYTVQDMFYVMCVEWEGGIAERRGLGVVTLESIAHSFFPGPTWQEIFLA